MKPGGISHGDRPLVAGAMLMAVATVIGAFGAHYLKTKLALDQYSIFQTAVQYQFIQALGLLLVGVLASRDDNRTLRIAGDLLLAGVLLFSGSLYLLLCGAPRLIGVLTPIGGVSLIAGWCLTAVALRRA